MELCTKKQQLIRARIYNKETSELTAFEKAGLKALKIMQNENVDNVSCRHTQ
ncbi:MAG: hypothetical protein QM654_13665 [Dysgonamonadaceae bacterium]